MQTASEVVKTNMGDVQINWAGSNADNWLTGTISSWEYPTVGAAFNKDLVDKFNNSFTQEEKMEKNKRGLYQIVLVNPKEGEIILNKFVISDKLEDALLEANAGEVIAQKGLKVSEVDKIVNFLGSIRKAKKNKEGIVELVEEN